MLSQRIRDMVADATIGMTDKEVLEATGLSYATWRKLHDGVVPSERTILQFCAGLGIDAEPMLEEREQALGCKIEHDKIMIAALELSDLPQDAKRSIMALYRELSQKINSSKQATNAA